MTGLEIMAFVTLFSLGAGITCAIFILSDRGGDSDLEYLDDYQDYEPRRVTRIIDGYNEDYENRP